MNEKSKILIIVGAIATVLLISGLVFSVTKGTFSVGEDAVEATLSCGGMVSVDNQITCTIEANLEYEFSGISFHYDLDENLDWVSFEPTYTCAVDSQSCLEDSDENGYLYIDIDDGLEGNITLGTLTLEFTDEVEINNTYEVALTDITLTDTSDQLAELNDINVTITISNVASPNYYEFDTNLIVDDENNIIKKLPVGTTYSQIIDKIDTNGEISIVDINDQPVENSNVIKTGDKILITFANNNSNTFTISVLGDVSGDGIIEINDVSKLYRYYRGRITMAEEYITAADVSGDNIIEINDVSKLYRYYRGKIDSLEG